MTGRYVIDGPGLFVPARMALLVARLAKFEELRAKHRGDPELAVFLSEWLCVATDYAVADRGGAVVPNAAPGGSSRPQGKTVTEIYQDTRIPKRTIRAALERKELVGERIAGRWWVPFDEVSAWLQSRPSR